MVDFGTSGGRHQAEAQSRGTPNPGPIRSQLRDPGVSYPEHPLSRSLIRLTKEAPASTNARGQAVLLGASGGLITKHYISQGAIWWGIKVPWYGMRYGMAHAPKVLGIASAARSRQVRCSLRCMWCGHAVLFQLRRCANAQPVMLHACAVMATRWPCAVMARRSWRCGHGVPWLRREGAVLAARAI